MDAPFFHELRRQASSYLTGKIRSARLALTDVTPTQLCVSLPRSVPFLLCIVLFFWCVVFGVDCSAKV